MMTGMSHWCQMIMPVDLDVKDGLVNGDAEDHWQATHMCSVDRYVRTFIFLSFFYRCRHRQQAVSSEVSFIFLFVSFLFLPFSTFSWGCSIFALYSSCLSFGCTMMFTSNIGENGIPSSSYPLILSYQSRTTSNLAADHMHC
jgi:hypothetical protein